MWTSHPINILGVEVTTESQELHQLNYANLLTKSEATLNSWKNRGLSIVGKIQVINSLVTSLFVYKMSVLPNLSQGFHSKINKIFEKFIWNDKRPKIPIAILQLNKQNGSLGLVNLYWKEKALKASWLAMLEKDQLLRKIAARELGIPDLEILEKANLSSKDAANIFTESFWKDVIIAWCEYNFQNQVNSPVDVAYQWIWFNSHLRIANKPIFMKNVYSKGLEILLQIVNLHGELMKAEILCPMFRLSIMEYNSIVAMIPNNWRKKLKK